MFNFFYLELFIKKSDSLSQSVRVSRRVAIVGRFSTEPVVAVAEVGRLFRMSIFF